MNKCSYIHYNILSPPCQQVTEIQ